MLHAWGTNASASYYGSVGIYDSRSFDWDDGRQSLIAISPTQTALLPFAEVEAIELGGGLRDAGVSYGHTWWAKQQAFGGWTA
jgi:hypothetical protein